MINGLHISSNLPFVAKQVMEKPTRRPSLTQTAMAGAPLLQPAPSLPSMQRRRNGPNALDENPKQQ